MSTFNVKCLDLVPRLLIERPPASFIMILKIIVPNAWSVLPSMTLQNELVGTVVKWQTTHESWQGAKGTYNGVTAELIQDDYDLWFRKVNDNHTKPNRNCYSVLIVQF